MVRLEKLVYEQVVNSAATARLRKVGAPRKWNHTNPYEHMACKNIHKSRPWIQCLS